MPMEGAGGPNWVAEAYRAALFLGAAIMSVMAVVAVRHRSDRRAPALAHLLLAMVWWSVFQAVEMMVPGLPAKLVVVRIEYLGIALVPVLWFLTSARFAGDNATKSRSYPVLLAMALVSLLLVWTNPYNLFWTEASLAPAGRYAVVAFERGPAFWGYLAYAYAALLGGSYLLARECLRSWQLYRRQALALLLAVVIPWAGNLIFLVGHSPAGNLDLTPLTFTITGLVMAWNVFGQRFFDVVPVALNTVFANLRDPLIVLDASDRVVGINQQAKRLLGKTDAEIIGQFAGRVFAAHADTVRRFENVEAAEAEITLPTPQGERVYDLSISSLCDGRGRPGGKLIALRDITERYRGEEEMRAALSRERELSELKSRFISMTSHEFRTPLAGILSSAELLERYGDRWPAEKKLRHLRQIQEGTQRMTQLLEDILIIGKAEAGRLEFQPEAVAVGQFCQDLVEEMQRLARPGQVIEPAWAGLEAPVRLDGKLLRSILGNLLSNALKYSPEGGKVRFGAERSDGQVVFTVADEGIGIPLADQAQLYETFHRATNVGTIPGTGLGLAIVKKAVDVHGGSIEFISRPDDGTTFTVRLPIQELEAVEPCHAC